MDTNFENFQLEERPKIQLEPGVRYTGSFWINEYGEFCCKPAQKGSRPYGGAYNLVYEGEQFTICESKNTYKLMLKWDKKGLCASKIMAAVQAAVLELTKHLQFK